MKMHPSGIFHILFLSSIVRAEAGKYATANTNDHPKNGYVFKSDDGKSFRSPMSDDERVLILNRPNMEMKQVGDDIDGDNYYDFAGTSVAFSADGEFLVVGAIGVKGYSGHVRTYRFDPDIESWVRRGQDLFGEGGGDESGQSVSMSSDGMRIAVGAPNNSRYYGHARVFEFNKDTEMWIQLGGDIDGETKEGQAGRAVVLSGDGNHLAIGSPYSRNLSGDVKVFEFVGEEWRQLGVTLAADQYYTSMGNSLALNDNGHRVIIGSSFHYQNGMRLVGAVGVFEFVAGEWIQLGSELTGDSYYDIFGDSVDINREGSRIVVGTPNKDDGLMSNVGKVEIYDYDVVEDEWLLVGGTIMGDEAGESLGTSVSMSGDGNRIVVGSERCDDGGLNAGCTWVFEYDSVSKEWWQIGESIYGEFPGDRSGRAVSISENGEYIGIGAPLNEYYNGHTRVYGIVGGGVSSDVPSFGPSSPPSHIPSFGPSMQPTVSPSKDDGCARSHRSLRIRINTDSHGAEDNWFVVKAYNDLTGGFTRRMLRRKNLKSDSSMVFGRCLPVDGCYIFWIYDRSKDGMCCEHGKGSFRVTWDGVTIRKGYRFMDGGRRRSPLFGDGCNNRMKLEQLMKDEIAEDLLYYEYSKDEIAEDLLYNE